MEGYSWLEKALIGLVTLIIGALGANSKRIIKAFTDKVERHLDKRNFDLKNHVFFSNIQKYVGIELRWVDIKDAFLHALILDYEAITAKSIYTCCEGLVKEVERGDLKGFTLEHGYQHVLQSLIKEANDREEQFKKSEYPDIVFLKLEGYFEHNRELVYAHIERIWFDAVYDNDRERLYAVLGVLDVHYSQRLKHIYKLILNFNGDLDELEYKGFRRGQYR